MKDRHLSIIRDILEQKLSAADCHVYLFGSRARGLARTASDIDLAVESAEDISRQVAHARTAFEESTLPYNVDLVDLRDASPALVEDVKTWGKLIWKR
jgi:predicted nucleotidyltransferase